MIDQNGVDVQLIYHVCYVCRSIFGDVVVQRNEPVHSEFDITQVHQAIASYLNGRDKPTLPISPREIALIQTPTLLGAKYFKNGKPYVPPIDAPN